MNLVRITSVAASSVSGIHICRREPRAPKNKSDAASGVKCHACGRTFNGPANGKKRTAMASRTNKYGSMRHLRNQVLFWARGGMYVKSSVEAVTSLRFG